MRQVLTVCAAFISLVAPLGAQRYITLRVFADSGAAGSFLISDDSTVEVLIFSPPKSEAYTRRILPDNGLVSIPDASSRISVCVDGFSCREMIIDETDRRKEFEVGLTPGLLGDEVSDSGALAIEVSGSFRDGEYLSVHLVPVFGFGRFVRIATLPSANRVLLSEVPFGTYIVALTGLCKIDSTQTGLCDGLPKLLGAQVVTVKDATTTIQLTAIRKMP